MPKILVNLSDRQKALWVEAAHDERVSLSEWVRRRCDAGLAAGESTDEGRVGIGSEAVASPAARKTSDEKGATNRPSPAASPADAAKVTIGDAQSRKCSADVARGTKCKLCGKVH